MTREEARRQAAESYARGIAQDAFKEMYCRTDFIAGAKWADQHPHWISVEDDVPKVEDKVLILFSDGSIDVRRFIFEKKNLNEGHITHWMPLPQAPKEGGNNE